MNKYVIYTCLTGNYDTLKQPLAVDTDFDYICFSNDIPDAVLGVWKIVRIPFTSKDKIVESRYVKLLPHNALQNYEYSVWMDANIQILSEDFYVRIKQLIESNCLIAQVNHSYPFRDCVYDEIGACIEKGRIHLVEGIREYHRLKKMRFPRHFGLLENNLIVRKHNDCIVVGISNQWWDNFNNGPKRDQFSLMPIYWKHNFTPDLIFPEDKCARNVDCLKCIGHKEKWQPTFTNKIKYWRDLANKNLFDFIKHLL